MRRREMAIDRCEIEAVLRKLLYGGLDLSEAADEITALASEYLRERDRYREALEDFLRDWDNGPVDRGTEGKLVDIAAKHADAFRDVLNWEE